MSPLVYIKQSGAATLQEIMELRRTDPAGADTLKRWAIEEMNFLGIEVKG